jgi:hypothetical protein
MIKNYGITFLAFGEEHINEFNTTVKCLFDFDNHLDIFVITDNQELIENKNIHIREINEPFNYNLKRKSIEFAFEYHNVVLFLDTDILFRGKPDFDYITTLEEGMYVRWISENTKYKDEEITIEDVLETEYGKAINDKDIKFINEFLMVLRIDDIDRRKLFTQTWDNLNNITLKTQPNNGYDGCLEGLIIYSVCNKMNIKVERPISDFFNNILNVGTLNEIRKTKTNKTIL